jgi:P pilus assembly chaperone PapD
MWTQDFANYSDTAKEQLEFENQRNREQLIVSYDGLRIGDNSYITVENPTAVVVIVSQVWNNHQLVNSTLTGVPPFSSVNITVPLTIYQSFTVVTIKGNLFYYALFG